jgi:hypothetical protein
MSLKRNIFANYASQIYVALIGIVIVPLYVRYMGAEAYGLVGFNAMLQALFTYSIWGLRQRLAARPRGIVQASCRRSNTDACLELSA